MGKISPKRFFLFHSFGLILFLLTFAGIYYILSSQLNMPSDKALLLIAILFAVMLLPYIWGVKIGYRKDVLGEKVELSKVVYFGGGWQRALKVLYWSMALFFIPLFAYLIGMLFTPVILLIEYLFHPRIPYNDYPYNIILLIVLFVLSIYIYIRLYLFLKKNYFSKTEDMDS